MTTKPTIVVVDLDGTLCNTGHRDHLAIAGQWDAFHGLMLEDEPWPDVQQMLALLDGAGYTVVGLTARPEKYRNQTMNWLDVYDINLDSLIMRPSDDWRRSEDLKPALLDDWLEAQSKAHSDIWFLLEDRDKVTERWRNLGHNCWSVRASGY